MKQFLIAIVAVLSFVETITAQEAGKQSVLKCVYLEEAINRADQPDKVKQDEFVLVLEGNKSAFYSRYNRTYISTKDSLLRLGMSAMEILSALQEMPKGKTIEIYKHQPEIGRYIQFEQIVKDYRFEDQLLQTDWQIGEETKEILGYTCQKAVGQLYGREWIVWFTMDIPTSDGPWLLTGLPGLILEASDSENLFHFTAIELGNDDSLSVNPTAQKVIRCTREELMEQRRKMNEDLIGTLQASLGVKIKPVRDPQGNAQKLLERKTNYYEKE